MRNNTIIPKNIQPWGERWLGFAFITVFCCLSALPHNAQAQDRDLLDLYKLAKVKDPLVSRAEARLDSVKADKDIAWAALLPRISANGAVRQLWHKVENYSAGDIDGEFTGYSYGMGGTLSFLNIPAYYQISSADKGISSADAGIQAARQDLIVRLLDAYLRCLKANADEKLYKIELNRVEKVQEQAQAFLTAGTGDIIAVYEAKARLDSAAADLVKTQGQLRLAQQNLASLTGIMVDTVKDIDVVNTTGPEPAELEWWIETMQQRSPALMQAREDLLQAEQSSKAARAGHYPTIQGNGGYTVDKGSTFLPKVETQQWYTGIRIDVPIYSGGDTSARTRRALAGESERRAQLNDAEEKAIARLKEAFLNLQYNSSLVDAYKRKHESAELQLKAVQRGRDIGTRTAIDLLNAEQGYAVSLRDLTSSRYDIILKQIELKAAAGILSEADLAAVNNQR